MRFYFVRHGETAWNKSRIFQGHTDIPLNETGIEQVKRSAEYLADKKIEAVYSSDLTRAVQTGDIIARLHNLQLIKDSRLREINFGKWEGLNFNEISEKYKEDLDAWVNDIINTRPTEGGMVKEVLRDLLSFLNDVVLLGYSEVAVATHGGAIKTLIWHARGGQVELWEQEVSLGSITILDYEHNSSRIALVKANIIT